MKCRRHPEGFNLLCKACREIKRYVYAIQGMKDEKTITGNIEIKISNHIANSHVFVNGKELHVTRLSIEADGTSIPRVLLEVPLIDGEVLASVNEADITFEELSKLTKEKQKA